MRRVAVTAPATREKIAPESLVAVSFAEWALD